MLGLVISLIGGVAPRLVKADGNLDVVVKGEAHVALEFGEVKSKLKSSTARSAASKSTTKKRTKAVATEGDKTMTTIGSILNGVGKASSLPGE